MKQVLRSPLTWLLAVFIFIFKDFFFFGKIPLPTDALVGAYLPWLDYKWGYAVGVPVKNALLSDAFSAFFVWKKLAIDLATRGVLPLWNKYSFSGTPLLATFHSAVLFPANLLLLLNLNTGWGLNIFLSSLTAAIFMYLFLGNWVKSRPGRFVGSLIFALAGPMTTWGEFGTAVWAAALLPLVLYSLDGIIIKEKKSYFTILSLSLGLLVFSGHVQILTYTAFIAPLYFLYRQKALKGKFSLQLSLSTIIAFILGVGLGAIQLLPSLDFLGRSIRNEENYLATYNNGLSHYSQLIRLWAADIFGNPTTLNSFSSFAYHEYSSYLGAITLPLIAAYFFSRRKGRTKASFFVYLFFIVLAITFDSPLSRFLFHLPLPLLTFSSASRLFFVLNLAAAVLAGLGLEELLKSKKSVLGALICTLFLSSLTLIAIVFVDQGHRSISWHNSLLYLAIFAAFIFLTLFLSSKRKLLSLLLVLIFVLDLSHYYLKYNPFVNQNLIFPITPVISFLKTQPQPFRLALENTNLLPANTWIAYELESVEGYDPLYGNDYAHFFHRLNDSSYFNGVSRYALLEGFNAKYLDASNVKFILTKSHPATAANTLSQTLEKNGYQAVFIDKSVTVYENPTVLPRAYFVDRLIFVKDKGQLGQLLDSANFDPRTAAAIEGSPFTVTSGKNSVISLVEEDNQVKIVTQSEKGGFLILADAYDPGWQAYLNGSPTPIYLANGAFRGVRVPAGESQLKFIYQPKSFQYGALISAFALAMIFFQLLSLKSNQQDHV